MQAADDSALYEEIIQNKQAVIIGDFNCPNVDYNSMYGDQDGNRLVKIVEDTFLTQMLTKRREKTTYQI